MDLYIIQKNLYIVNLVFAKIDIIYVYMQIYNTFFVCNFRKKRIYN